MATTTLERPATTTANAETMDEIYAGLRAEVETEENIGKFLVVERNTRDYEIGRDLAQAGLTLRSRHREPEIYAYRIGYPALFSHGIRMERLA